VKGDKREIEMETFVKWDHEAIEQLRTRLVEWKHRIVRSVPTIPAEESKVDADDLPDEMDAAATEHSRSLLLELRERDRSLLSRIEGALRRIANGSFATCDRCGQEIAPSRLQALPVTTLCIDCQEEEEIELRRISLSSRRTL
jgi:DnaK suppressor protein